MRAAHGTRAFEIDDDIAEAFLGALAALEWQRDAACAEHRDDVDFFPERGVSTKAAKAVCASCLVRAECLDYALELGLKHGIWGGLSERERRRIRSARAERAIA